MSKIAGKSILIILIYAFLLRFPPLYFLGIKNILFTTHFFGVIMFIIVSSILLFNICKSNKKIFPLNWEIILILLFFATQSLSVIGSTNIPIFFHRYWKIVIGISLFFLIKHITANPKVKSDFTRSLIPLLLIGSAFATFLQLILFFYPTLYFNIGEILIYSNVFDITKTNFTVGKLFDDSFLEIVIPVLFYFLFKGNVLSTSNIFILFLILANGFIAFASNFRYRLLSFIFACAITVFIFPKIRKKLIILIPLVILIFTIFKISDSVLMNVSGYTVIDRLTNQSTREDLGTILWRFKMYENSINMALSNPVGVGLGNFYDNITDETKFQILSKEEKKIRIAALESGPHNIFFQYLGETGFVGFFSFLALIIFYLKKDFKIIKINKEPEKKILIASFWTLIFIAQFFPPLNLTFYSLFFMLRALI